jgi:taspase (threonine aspartase 1)
MYQNLQSRQPRISNKLTSARSRLRRFSAALQIPFRKSEIVDTTSISSPPPNYSTGEFYEVIEPTEMSSPTPSSDSGDASMSQVMDGATERLIRRSHQSQARPGLSAIFVHAGAGYHSTTNEHIHLGACNEYVCLYRICVLQPFFISLY